MTADLTIRSTDGSQRVINMVLTDAAWQQAARLSLALEGAGFVFSYCTDCPAPTGLAWLDYAAQGYRYDYQRPPPGMQAFDRFIRQLIEQGRECQGALLQRCQPAPQ
jgi:hypothetical protein